MRDSGTTSQETVRGGVICIGCGYELAGLPMEGGVVCPECGVPIEESLTGPLLRLEGVGWLERVARGLGQAKVGVTGIVVSWIGGLILIAMLVIGMYGFLGEDFTFEVGGLVLTNVHMEYALLYAVRLASMFFVAYATLGVWRVTTPFEVSAHVEGVDWRGLARAFPFIFLGSILGLSIGSRAYTGGLLLDIAAASFIAIASSALFAGYHATRRHLSELDGRCAGKRAFEPDKPYTPSAIVARVLVVAFFVWGGTRSGFDAMGLPIFCFSIGWFFLAKRYHRIRQRVRAELDAAKLQAS